MLSFEMHKEQNNRVHFRLLHIMQFAQITFVVVKAIIEAKEEIVVVVVASSFSEIILARYIQTNHNAKSMEK